MEHRDPRLHVQKECITDVYFCCIMSAWVIRTDVERQENTDGMNMS